MEHNDKENPEDGQDIGRSKNAAPQSYSFEQLGGLVEIIPTMVFVAQQELFVYLNAGFEEITGYKSSDYLGKEMWELIHPDFKESLQQRYQARMRGESISARFEARVMHRDGQEHWADFSVGLVNINNQPSLLGIVYDISDRKLAEANNRKQNERLQILYEELQASSEEMETMNEELQYSQEQLLELNARVRESEERYRTLLLTIPEIVAQVDVNGIIVWVNDAGQKFFGENICGQHYSNRVFDATEAEQIMQMIDALFNNTEEVWRWENHQIRKDGQIRLLEWHSKALKNEERIIGILSTGQDITEIREAEDKLKASERKYRELFDQSPVGLIKWDMKGNITDINQYCIELVGAPSREMALQINVFNSEENLKNEITRSMEKVFELGQSVEGEVGFSSRWGKDLMIHYKVDPVRDSGIISEAVVAIIDISERNEAQEKIRYLSFNDKLTGVYNRAFFEEEIQRLDTVRQLPLTIIMGDINGLKLVNDAFGHLAGDRLLINIANILRNACRDEDIVARWGGDEFVILLPQTKGETAQEICSRITRACQDAVADPIQLSIALGYASKEKSEQDIYEVLREAENNMYRSKLLQGKSIRNSIISALEVSLRAKTHESREHSDRLRSMALKFAGVLNLEDNQMNNLLLLANLHDIGKTGIPDEILNKPGPLSMEEWEIIKQHPEIGYRILQSTPRLAPIAEEVLAHHERWDGNGYPKGLNGREIPFLARMLAIMDAFDVMTHDRSYQQAIKPEEALQEIKRCAGTQFDPDLAHIFIELMKEG